MVRTACERDEAWLRFVDDVERCFVARLVRVSVDGVRNITSTYA